MHFRAINDISRHSLTNATCGLHMILISQLFYYNTRLTGLRALHCGKSMYPVLTWACHMKISCCHTILYGSDRLTSAILKSRENDKRHNYQLFR